MRPSGQFKPRIEEKLGSGQTPGRSDREVFDPVAKPGHKCNPVLDGTRTLIASGAGIRIDIIYGRNSK